MRKIEIVNPDRSSPSEPSITPQGRVIGPGQSWPASPPGASLWMTAVELASGSKLRFDRPHGEEALFVERGELVVDGRVCLPGSAVVIEAQAGPTTEARIPTRVLHMGAHDAGKGRVGAAVHRIGPRGVYEALEPGRETRFFADASCPGCSLWLLFTARSFGYESPVHSHSQDELIHVLRGQIRIGSLTAVPGSSVFITADQPYRFRSGDEGFAFLNYRRGASVMTLRRSGEKIIETGAATGMTAVLDVGSSTESDRAHRPGGANHGWTD